MNKLPKTDKTLLQTIILMVVTYAWISLLGAIFGMFYPIAIWSIWLLLCIILFSKKILIFTKPSKEFLLYIFITLTFASIITFYTVPTIFSGRDQGALSEASMRLVQSHSLLQHTTESTAFFKIYGYGKALNFPGFFYQVDGALITQFPLPYTSFIAGFYGIFNTAGFIIANFILLSLFILTIAFIARYYMSKRYTLIFLVILLTSFSIGWFAKFTLSENIAGTLLWSALFLYLFLKENNKAITYFTIFLTLSLLLVTRIEGIWFFAIFIFLLLRNSSIRTLLRNNMWWYAIFPSITLFVIVFNVAFMNIPFFITILKAGTNAGTGEGGSQIIDKINYLFSIYALYGLLAPLALTLIASILAIRHKSYRKFLLPLIIVLPLMLYYIFPNISSDHPWMLRRFVFALLPATILISITFISYISSATLLHRLLKYTLIILLFVINLPAFLTFITYAENATLTQQITILSQKFSDNDLLLIDKNAAGSGWSMITNPLHSLNNKHAVYFFNPLDYDKLNTTSFDNVYLITSNKNEQMYTDVLGDKMRYNGEYTFTLNQLKSFGDELIFPMKQYQSIGGAIYKLNKN